MKRIPADFRCVFGSQTHAWAEGGTDITAGEWWTQKQLWTELNNCSLTELNAREKWHWIIALVIHQCQPTGQMRARPVATVGLPVHSQCMLGKAITFMWSRERAAAFFLRWIYALQTKKLNLLRPWSGF